MSKSPMSREYAAPGPGTWIQDSTHSPRPVTMYHFENFKEPFCRGFREGTARFGLLFDYLQPASVNGFIYYRHMLVDGSDKDAVGRRFEAARAAYEGKFWLADLDRWDREYKPDSIKRNKALEAVPMRELDNEALIRHMLAVRDNAVEMVYRHHIFTATSVLPVGGYLANAGQWTGLDAGQLLAPLKGSSPVSLGAHEELMQVGAALKQTGVGPAAFSGAGARDTLDALCAREDGLGAATRAYLAAIGMRLAGGYDVADPCAMELPEMLLGAIWASPEETARTGGEAATAKVRDAVPAEHRPKFDELLDDAIKLSRLRDERGVYG
ncbi:MAG: hypothetical protein ABIS67_07175, partial [Candidatus Eisenbacteria bacterium]